VIARGPVGQLFPELMGHAAVLRAGEEVTRIFNDQTTREQTVSMVRAYGRRQLDAHLRLSEVTEVTDDVVLADVDSTRGGG
jgi:hypothetical protein